MRSWQRVALASGVLAGCMVCRSYRAYLARERARMKLELEAGRYLAMADAIVELRRTPDRCHAE